MRKRYRFVDFCWPLSGDVTARLSISRPLTIEDVALLEENIEIAVGVLRKIATEDANREPTGAIPQERPTNAL